MAGKGSFIWYELMSTDTKAAGGQVVNRAMFALVGPKS